MSSVINPNYLIEGVKCLLDCKTKLKVNTRQQFSKGDLSSIIAYCSIAGETLVKGPTDDEVSMAINYIFNAQQQCESELAKPDFSTTDTETKEFITDKLLMALNSLCLAAGKYYTTHEFSYNVLQCSTYNYIIDNCIMQNYYFGLEKEVGY